MEITTLNDKIPSLQVDITNRCNFRCLHCPRALINKVGDMDYSLYTRMLDQFDTRALGEVTLGGWGEPLLHPKIFDFIRYAKKKGARVHLANNGSLLTKGAVVQLLESGLSTINISIDAYKKDTLAFLRPNSEKYDIFGNVERLIHEKRKAGKYLKVNLLYLLNKYNADELDDFIKWAVSIGVDSLLISEVLLRYPHLASCPPEISNQQAEKIRRDVVPKYFTRTGKSISKARKIANKYRFIKNILRKPYHLFHRYRSKPQVIFKLRRSSSCPCPYLEGTLFISWDGGVYPCCSYSIYEKHRLALTPYSLPDIYHSEELDLFRRNYPLYGLCKICPEILSTPI